MIVGTDDLGAQYTVIVTRTGDGVTIGACPIIYDGAQGLSDVFTGEGPWMIYDIMGRVIVPLTDGNHIPVISSPGVYILVRPQTHKTTKIIIR